MVRCMTVSSPITIVADEVAIAHGGNGEEGTVSAELCVHGAEDSIPVSLTADCVVFSATAAFLAKNLSSVPGKPRG